MTYSWMQVSSEKAFKAFKMFYILQDTFILTITFFLCYSQCFPMFKAWIFLHDIHPHLSPVCLFVSSGCLQNLFFSSEWRKSPRYQSVQLDSKGWSSASYLFSTALYHSWFTIKSQGCQLLGKCQDRYTKWQDNCKFLLSHNNHSSWVTLTWMSLTNPHSSTHSDTRHGPGACAVRQDLRLSRFNSGIFRPTNLLHFLLG